MTPRSFVWNMRGRNLVAYCNQAWKRVCRLGLAEEDSLLYVEQLGQLALCSRSTAELAADALEITLAYDITAYAAVYVALSARLAVPLITTDERLIRALHGAPLDVRWLGALPGPTAEAKDAARIAPTTSEGRRGPLVTS
jgi:hypothetical protein